MCSEKVFFVCVFCMFCFAMCSVHFFKSGGFRVPTEFLTLWLCLVEKSDGSWFLVGGLLGLSTNRTRSWGTQNFAVWRM